MTTLANLTRARDGASTHLLRINPAVGRPDYVIAYQSGFVLRQFAEPNGIFDFGGTAAGREEAERLVRRAGQLATLPQQVRSQMAGVLLDGVLTQLRSFPIGMRIDVWLRRDFPELADLQREAIERQQKDNLQALRAEVRNFAPKQFFDANAAMNAAYAIFADRLLGNAGFAIPWRAAGLEKAGRILLESFDRLDPGPDQDRALVDAWAAELGLVGWYRWLPVASGGAAPEAGR